MKSPDSHYSNYESQKSIKNVNSEYLTKIIQANLDHIITTIYEYSKGNSDIMDAVLKDILKKTSDYSVDVISLILKDDGETRNSKQREKYVQGRLFYD
jgi:hypothetical protein